MKRSAFTLLELLFVIVVIGIIAVLAMPSLNSNPLQKAAEQVANHIRYTQHLAMVDDKFDSNDSRWYIENWQMQFKLAPNGGVYYEIFSDTDHNGNSDNNESALDPLTKQPLDANNDITDITKKFAISTVSFSASCRGNGTGKEIAFDSLGRPYYYITNVNPPATNMYQYILTSDCNITLTHTDGNATIIVRPETGYVSVVYK